MSNENETNYSSSDYNDTTVQVTFFFSNVPTVNKQISSNFQQLFYDLDVAVGILGFCANGLLFVLLFRDKKLRTNPCNVLILNQTAIDIFASFILALTYTVKLQGLYYASGWSRFYCRMFDNNATLAVALNGSMSCLMVISFERYMKICHSILYKNRFSSQMQKAALAFPWIYSAIITFPLTISTSDVINGRCISGCYWPARWVQQLYGVGNTVWKFLLPIGVFVACYTKILMKMKEQGRIHAHHSTTNTGQNALTRSEKNIVMMLLCVVVFYIVSYTPINTYYMLFNFNVVSIENSTFPILLSLSYLNMCANPIIYAVKYEVFGTFVSRLRRKMRTVDNTTVQNTLPTDVI